MKHTVNERTEIRERSEEWKTEIDGFIIIVNRDNVGLTQISIAPSHYTRMRLPLLSFHPKYVSDIEQIAESLPSVLKSLVSEMREDGLDDLRSRWDKMEDGINKRVARGAS